MFKHIKKALFGLGLSFAALSGGAEEAKAGDYCREYTRTVYIGNRTEDAYGRACLQPDGSWMIVGEGLGNDIPGNASNVDYVIHDNNRYVTPPRVVYYDRTPRYSYRPAPLFVWYDGGHYRGGHHYKYKKKWDHHDHWDRHDRRDRYDDHRGHGRGHDRGRGNGHDRD